MALPPEFMEDLRSRVTLSDIIGKRVKLIRKGNRMNGLCPFHREKSPSFYVNDTDGFYHCFGCGVHGDAISFLREQEGLDFMEAVRQLADQAGIAVPQTAPIDPERTRQRQQAMDILEAGTRFYQSSLMTDAGRTAAHYLQSRGLTDDIIRQFRLGYAPRTGLKASLEQKSFSPDAMKTAGLIGESDRDGSLYDYFRDRVMFPIENRQGKIIAFGARALGDAQPKYLNSPEGPTFSKKAVLYGWNQARERVRRGLPLLLVEGYMDVIAVTASDVAAALAPLGTALTEQQIQLVWKLHDEPILCFDGDAAGQKAAFRAIERIFPLLEPGKSVRIAVLPEGQDPDDILKSDGPDGLTRVVNAANSLIDAAWRFVASGFNLSEPGARAAFWGQLRGLVRTIAHNQTRQAFSDEIEFRIRQMRATTRTADASGYQQLQSVRRPRPTTGSEKRYGVLLSLLLHHPQTVNDRFEALSMLNFGTNEFEDMKNALLDRVIRDPDLDAPALKHHLETLGYSETISVISTGDIRARLTTAPEDMSPPVAEARIDEIIALASQRSRRG